MELEGSRLLTMERKRDEDKHPTGGSNSFPPEQHARVLANTAHPQGEGRRLVRCPALQLTASSAGMVPKKKKKG